MVQGLLEVGRLVALVGKCLGYASVIGVAAFFYRMYQMRMLLRRAQSDHGVVCVILAYRCRNVFASRQSSRDVNRKAWVPS
jgi:hypothetical protein